MKQDHEAVRLRAIEIGVRPAARELGLNEDRVLQWSKREQWFKQPPDIQKANVITVIKPGDAALEELAENKRQTKLSLSRYSARAAKDSEQLSVWEAPLVHKVAQISSLVWPEESGDRGLLSVAVLVQNNVTRSGVSE